MKRSGGFTVVEVMVAMVVLAIALGAIIQATAGGGARLSELNERTLAHWVAENRLAEMLAMEAYDGGGRGSVEMAGREWFWQAETEDTELPNLRRVEIRVSAEEGARDAIVVLTGFLPDPELRQSAAVAERPPEDDGGDDGDGGAGDDAGEDQGEGG